MIMNALRLLRLAIFAACVSLAPAASFAVQPNEILSDAALEKRARELSAELRCLVCQNQSIDDSSAPLARDLRLVVRERLVAGDTNEQVMTYVVQRYGEFILLRPPLRLGTLLLLADAPVRAGRGPYVDAGRLAQAQPSRRLAGDSSAERR